MVIYCKVLSYRVPITALRETLAQMDENQFYDDNMNLRLSMILKLPMEL